MLHTDHGDAKGLQFLGEAQTDLAHADDDNVAETRGDAASEDRGVASGEEIVDDARGEERGESHDEECGGRGPEEQPWFVRQDRRGNRRRGAGGVIKRAHEIRVAQPDEGVGQDDGEQAGRAAQQHARAGIVGAELSGQTTEQAARFERFGRAVGFDAGAFFAALRHGHPLGDFRRRGAADGICFRMDGAGDHGRHGNGGGREHHATGHDAAQLRAGGAVEHGDEESHVRADVMDHESVAQGLDVVVQHDGHAVDIVGKFGAHFGIGGLVQVRDGKTGGGEQGTHAAAHIRSSDDDNATRFHPEGASAVGCFARNAPAQ